MRYRAQPSASHRALARSPLPGEGIRRLREWPTAALTCALVALTHWLVCLVFPYLAWKAYSHFDIVNDRQPWGQALLLAAAICVLLRVHPQIHSHGLAQSPWAPSYFAILPAIGALAVSAVVVLTGLLELFLYFTPDLLVVANEWFFWITVTLIILFYLLYFAYLLIAAWRVARYLCFAYFRRSDRMALSHRAKERFADLRKPPVSFDDYG